MTYSCVLTEHHEWLVAQLCAAFCVLTKNDADPHFLVTFHLSNSSVRLASSLLRKRQRRQSHIFYDCSSSQCPENLARLPPQFLSVQQEPTPHWVADGSGSTIWTDKLANSPFARFLVSDTCLWGKYQATEMLCSEEALSCAPNSTTLTSEKT